MSTTSKSAPAPQLSLVIRADAVEVVFRGSTVSVPATPKTTAFKAAILERAKANGRPRHLTQSGLRDSMAKRQPRQPVTGLPAHTSAHRPAVPAHYDDADMLAILTYLREKYAHTFEANFSVAAFEAFFLRRMQSEDKAQSSIDAIYICDLARRGDPSADMAVRKCIILANREGRFGELPLAVRAFNDELLMRPPVTQYPSQAGQIITHLVRDLTLGGLVEVIQTKFPHLPRWNSERQKSYRFRVLFRGADASSGG